MIVSFSKKFVFVAIPKTASQSIRQVLNAHLSETDWQQEAMFHQRRIPIEHIAAKNHGHIMAQEIMPFVSPWNAFYSFAVVRNPFDRFISTCFFRQQSNPKFLENPIPYLKTIARTNVLAQDIWYLPQTFFVCNSSHSLLVNHLIRFEDLTNDLLLLEKNIGVSFGDLPKINTSNHQYFKQYFDNELLELVAKRYAIDFEILNYEKTL